MRISVVIATFNRAPLLEITLKHLRQQAYEPGDEIIVVDNASTDCTPAVLARATEDFPVRFVSLREEASGKTPALNTGVAAATGDILALTDDDVVVADDWVATIRRIFRESPVHLVGGRVEPVWERPAPAWLRVEEDGRYGPLAAPLALLHYGEAQELGARTAVGANLMVRRDVLNALGGFAAHLGRRPGTLLCGEDHDLCERASTAGYQCEYRPEVRVRHWVPASRVRLWYYLRWFFWLGVTEAMLERRTTPRARLIPPYLVRQLMMAPAAALRHLLVGRSPSAATAIMDGAYALGNLGERLRDRLRAESALQPDDRTRTAHTHATFAPSGVRAGHQPANPAGAKQQ